MFWKKQAEEVSDSVFTFDSDNLTVTQQMTDAYDRNGYILVRKLLSQEEIAKVRHAVEHSDGIQKHAYGRDSDDGKTTSRLCVWNHPGDDVTGMLVRSHMIAGTMEELMGGEEIYHYHSKLMMKEAKTGGPWCWHQDYGYWYHNGCLFPEMGSVFIPVDDCTKENGCLQVIKGSHRLGRVEHGKDKNGWQMMADNERVQEALKQMELVPVEMSAGDVLFFHCNLLHTSSQNTSEYRRWAIIVSFNKKRNNPYKEHHHPKYTPLVKVSNSALLECNNIEKLEGKWFHDPATETKYVDDDKQMVH